jgi:hypothetical protein
LSVLPLPPNPSIDRIAGLDTCGETIRAGKITDNSCN